MNELLSPLCGLLLEEKPPRVAASAAHAGPVGEAGFSLTPRSYPHPPQWVDGAGESGIVPTHSPNSTLFFRGLGSPTTSPQHSVPAEEETLAE